MLCIIRYIIYNAKPVPKNRNLALSTYLGQPPLKKCSFFMIFSDFLVIFHQKSLKSAIFGQSLDFPSPALISSKNCLFHVSRISSDWAFLDSEVSMIFVQAHVFSLFCLVGLNFCQKVRKCQKIAKNSQKSAKNHTFSTGFWLFSAIFGFRVCFLLSSLLNRC